MKQKTHQQKGSVNLKTILFTLASGGDKQIKAYNMTRKVMGLKKRQLRLEGPKCVA